MENYIKEAKNGFGFDRMNSHSYQVNEAKMMISLLAYNLVNWLRLDVFRRATEDADPDDSDATRESGQ